MAQGGSEIEIKLFRMKRTISTMHIREGSGRGIKTEDTRLKKKQMAPRIKAGLKVYN